jgi:hypothetical protein
MRRRDYIKIGAVSVAGIVSLTGCIGPGGEEDEEGGEGGEGEGEGGGGEDKIESAQRNDDGDNALARPE